MVNIAGRSRGCQTCRRRRIKCDEGKPTCAKCANSKLECEGYAERGFIQVDFSTQAYNGKTKASKPKHTYPKRPQKERIDLSGSSSSSESSSPARAASQDAPEDITFNDLVVVNPIPVPQTLPPSGFLDLICQSYTADYIFRGVSNPQFLFPIDGALTDDPSVLALSNVYFGARHHDSTTTGLAQRRYTKSVGDVSSLLRGSDIPNTDTIVAVFTLGLYEFVAPTQVTGWIWHFMGLAALLERIGPERVGRDKVLRDVLITSYTMIGFAAMVVRKEVAVARPEWKKILYMGDQVQMRVGYYGTGLDDILMDMLHMLLLYDEALKQASPDTAFQAAMAFGEQTEARLNSWMDCWAREPCFFSAVRETEPETNLPPTDQTTGQPYWTTNLSFVNIRVASELTRYWALRVMLTGLMLVLRSQKAKWEGQVLDRDAVQETRRELAVNICRSVEFVLTEPVQGIGSFMMLFPLRIAHRTFDEGDPRRAFVVDVMNMISGKKGSLKSADDILELQNGSLGRQTERKPRGV